jgi:cyclomaltodextrinase / maltogenic alpha-amylase / neopullulanase
MKSIFSSRILLAFAAVLLADTLTKDPGVYLHHFEYDPPAGSNSKSVFVGGEFNNWSQTAVPMKPDAAGRFLADVKLPEGPHSYRFFVDGAWVNDSEQHSEADLEESNGIRGRNSAIFVAPDAAPFPKPQPGRIAAEALHHVPSNIRYFDAISSEEARVAFGSLAGNLMSAAVYFAPGTGETWRRDELSLVESRQGMDYFAGIVTASAPDLRYFFELTDGANISYYAGGKYQTNIAAARRGAWRGRMQPAFETPEWAQHAVWYQIFPERFRNGDKGNDPANTSAWTMKWASTPPPAPAPVPAPDLAGGRGGRGGGGGRGNNPGNRHYGGDIQGIQEELPYLRSLGVTCLYLNPIFRSPSIHKYDTADYRHLDDNFGVARDAAEDSGETEDPATWKWTSSDKLFLDFVAEAHRQGFKVVIDGVFNHAGSQFGPFLDLRRNGQKSEYADWFTVSKWDPLTWISFGDRPGGNMPEFKKDPVTGLAAGPRDFVFNITRRWLAPDGNPSRGVDGFRLDYAQNVPRVFWVAYRKFVKSIKPDAYIAGEIWTPATSYLEGDAWDATMQYPFSNALQAFFIDGPPKKISATVFARRLQQFGIVYPFQVSINQMNLLDSHDTDRWASRFVNADRPPAPSPAGGRRNYNNAKPTDVEWRRMEQSLAVQMTAVGAPMVYYGDEAGMWGGTDPDDRQPMIWQDLGAYDDPDVKFNRELFDRYVRLIAIHRRFPALQTGFARTLLADDARSVLVYSRDLGDEHVYVIVNRSDGAQSIELPIGPSRGDASWIDWLDSSEAVVRNTISEAPDRRPEIQPEPDARPAVVSHHGKATIALKPWGSMILTQMK